MPGGRSRKFAQRDADPGSSTHKSQAASNAPEVCSGWTGQRPAGHVARPVEVDQREPETSVRVTVRDPQHVVLHAELVHVAVDAFDDLVGQRHEHEGAEQHDLQHALPEALLAVVHRGAKAAASSHGTRSAGTTNLVIDSTSDSISNRCNEVSEPLTVAAAATPPAIVRASAASGGVRLAASAAGNGTGTPRIVAPGSKSPFVADRFVGDQLLLHHGLVGTPAHGSGIVGRAGSGRIATLVRCG